MSKEDVGDRGGHDGEIEHDPSGGRGPAVRRDGASHEHGRQQQAGPTENRGHGGRRAHCGHKPFAADGVTGIGPSGAEGQRDSDDIDAGGRPGPVDGAVDGVVAGHRRDRTGVAAKKEGGAAGHRESGCHDPDRAGPPLSREPRHHAGEDGCTADGDERADTDPGARHRGEEAELVGGDADRRHGHRQHRSVGGTRLAPAAPVGPGPPGVGDHGEGDQEGAAEDQAAGAHEQRVQAVWSERLRRASGAPEHRRPEHQHSVDHLQHATGDMSVPG